MLWNVFGVFERARFDYVPPSQVRVSSSFLFFVLLIERERVPYRVCIAFAVEARKNLMNSGAPTTGYDFRDEIRLLVVSENL